MVIDRYILRLWLVPFGAFVGIVVSVLMLARSLRVLGDVVDKGGEGQVMLHMMLALLPYFMMLALPMGSFFAMLAMVRSLQKDSELDAFRAAGVSYLRLFRSLVVATMLLWALLTYISVVWLPVGQKTFMDLLDSVRQSKSVPGFDPQRFNQDMQDFTVYINGVDADGRYQGFMLEDDRSSVPVVYMAESARIMREGNWMRFVLDHGYRLEGQGENLRSLAFEAYQVSLDMGKFGFERFDINRGVLQWSMLHLWQAFHQKPNPAAEAEWYQRLVVPTMVLIFPLFVLPIALEPKRSGRSGMYVSGIALVLLAYNVYLAVYQKVYAGVLPGWSMWIPQLLLLLAGIELSRRKAQDRMPAFWSTVVEFFTSVHVAIQNRVRGRWGGKA